MLIPLICTQCGGKLEVEDTKVSISGDTVIVLPGQKFNCPHCGTKYLPGDKSRYASNIAANIRFDRDFNGDLIIGTNNTIINSPTPRKGDKTDSQVIVGEGNLVKKPPVESKNSPKQWWQFWK